MPNFNTNTRRRLWSITSLTLAVLLFGFVDTSYQTYNDSWRLGEQAVDNVARLAEQSISRELKLYDLSLQSVAKAVIDPRIMQQDPDIRAGLLFADATRADGLRNEKVLDQDGNILFASRSLAPPRINLADREYFAVHTGADVKAGLYISSPFRARSETAEWGIALSRRISNPDGSFKGVAFGYLKVEYFNNILRKATLGAGGNVTVVRDDGILIGRSDFSENLFAKNWQSIGVFKYLLDAPQGFYTFHSINDGINRLYAYRRVEGTALVLMAALPVKDILGLWQARTTVAGLIIGVLVLLVITLVTMLDKELVKRADAESMAQLLARTDALTGVANRRMLDESLKRELARSTRNGGCVSLLMIDIDFFKKYNDTYGHRKGDEALMKVANAIGASVRLEVDLVARYGGEEFAVVVVHERQDDVNVVAERIFKNIDLAAIPFTGGLFGRLTISCGAATMEGGTGSIASLIEEADRKLYIAKRAGRNQIIANEMEAKRAA